MENLKYYEIKFRHQLDHANLYHTYRRKLRTPTVQVSAEYEVVFLVTISGAKNKNKENIPYLLLT